MHHLISPTFQITGPAVLRISFVWFFQIRIAENPAYAHFTIWTFCKTVCDVCKNRTSQLIFCSPLFIWNIYINYFNLFQLKLFSIYIIRKKIKSLSVSQKGFLSIINYYLTTLAACGPRLPSSMSKVTV